MKGGPAALRPLTRWIVVALLGGVVGCGRTGMGGNGAAAGGRDNGLLDAATSADLLDTHVADASVEAAYSGVVLAMITQNEAATTYVARTDFTTGPRPAISGCPHCCCGPEGRGLPKPVKPPDAGRITIAAAAGATTLAMLVPFPFKGGSGEFYGMSDLGWPWYRPLSDYAPVDSQPWSLGDSLQVVAAGNEVEPFSGTLQTGTALAGITPPIGPSAVVVDHSQAFEVSWTAEGKDDGIVLLSLGYSGGVCYCDAPVSAGRLVVGANLLKPVQGGTIKLARLTISTVASGNASIDLVGAVIQAGPLTVE